MSSPFNCFLNLIEKFLFLFNFRNLHARKIYQIIRYQEIEYEVRLTRAARKMLFIPIDEISRLGVDIDWSEVHISLAQLLSSIKEDPAPMEKKFFRERRSSLSVIRAFWRKYCNIPPFCQKTDEELRR